MKQLDLLKATGKALRKVRLEKDIEQQDVSAATGIHKSTYSRLEAGIAHIHLSHVVELAEYYEIPPGQLVDKIMEAGNG